MKIETPIHRIKRARREAQLQKIIAGLLTQQALDDNELRSLTVTRVEISASRSVCYILFYSPDGEGAFKEKLQQLILYKPSLRKAIGDELQGRYVPEVIFKYDTNLNKQLALEKLLDDVADHDSNTQ